MGSLAERYVREQIRTCNRATLNILRSECLPYRGGLLQDGLADSDLFLNLRWPALLVSQYFEHSRPLQSRDDREPEIGFRDGS